MTEKHGYRGRVHQATLISKDFFMSTYGGNNNSHFAPDISCSIVHGNAKCPLISSLYLFISQSWIGWVGDKSFKLFPEFNSNFFRKVIELLKNGIRDDDVSRQNVF